VNIFSFGNGLPPDVDVAATWYQQAAEQGNEVARHRLEVSDFKRPMLNQ
jgi:TPR repeat protein